MPGKSKLIALLSLGLLGGCADYLNNYETETLAAGDTQRVNRFLQTEDPFNPNSADVTIMSDGKRVVRVIKDYQGGGGTALEGATSEAGAATAPTAEGK